MVGRHITSGELDARLAIIDSMITRFGDQLAAHERWHRDILIESARDGAGRRLAVWAMAVAMVAAIAAVITAVVTVAG